MGEPGMGKAVLWLKRTGNAVSMMILLAGASSVAAAAPGDIVFERKDARMEGFPVAVFPHWKHRIHYRCYVCHSEIFAMKRGASEVSMAAINAGESCGKCHDGQVAFGTGFEHCGKCHPAAPGQAGP